MLELEEFRAELADDNFNFMGLTAPKRVKYLNFSDTVRDFVKYSDDFTVVMTLSRKVTI